MPKGIAVVVSSIIMFLAILIALSGLYAQIINSMYMHAEGIHYYLEQLAMRTKEHLTVNEWTWSGGKYSGYPVANIVNDGSLHVRIVAAYWIEEGPGPNGAPVITRIIEQEFNPRIELGPGQNTTIKCPEKLNRAAYTIGGYTLTLHLLTERGNIFKTPYIPDYGWVKIIAYWNNMPATFDVKILRPDGTPEFGWDSWKTYKYESPSIKLLSDVEYIVRVRIMGQTYDVKVRVDRNEEELVQIWGTTPPPKLVPGKGYWFMDFKDKDELFIKALNQKGIVQWYGTGDAGYWNNMIYAWTEDSEEEWLIFKVYLSGGEYAILARLYMTGPGQVEVYINGEHVKTYNISIGYTDKVLNITRNMKDGYNYISFHVFNGTSIGVYYLWIATPGAELLPVSRELDYLWPGTVIAFEDGKLKVKEEGLLFYEGFDDEDSISSWSPSPSNQWGIDSGLVMSSARFIASDQYLNGTLTKTISLSSSGVLVVYGYSESGPDIIGGGSEIEIGIDGTYYTISAYSNAWEYRKISITSGTHTLTIKAQATDPGYGANIDHLMIVRSLNIVIQGLKPGWIIEIKGSDLNGNPITITITAGSSQVVIDCEQLGLYHWPLKDVTITLYRTSE